MTSPQPTELNPDEWIEKYGDHLYGFAWFRVRNDAVAEDLVQDTLLAAFKARDRFQGKSAERTWLTGILKNKIYDHFRKKGREITQTDLALPGDDPREFEENGHINMDFAPRNWGSDPIRVAESADFQVALKKCLSQVPDRAAEVFLSREIDGESTEEITARLGISANNLWVLLHRARKLLRKCLEINYFESSSSA